MLLTAALLFAATTAARADDVLRVGLFALPLGLGNPHSSVATSDMGTWAAIFDSLTQVDANSNVVPSLATSWENLDQHTWQFELRRDVSFSNGEPFDAEAVVAALGYLISEEATGESVARTFADVASVRALDSHRVEVKTKTPVVILPALMAGLRIPAPDQWRRLGPKGFAREPIGTGPYQVENWSAARIELSAFSDSWRPPKIGRVEIYSIPDTAVRLQGLQSGELDIALALEADDVPALERSSSVAYIDGDAGVSGLSFITVKEGPMQNVRVRQAINYAVDKEAIVEILFGGYTQPAGQPVPRTATGYNPEIEPYPYDPARAKALLREAGYENGFEFVAEVVTGGGVVPTPVLAVIAEQLTAVGVRMEVRSIPTSQVILKAVTGTFDGSAFSMGFSLSPTRDPQNALGMHSCLRAIPWHCDEAVVPLIEAAATEFDPAKRLALLQDIMRIFHETAPMLYLYESVLIDGLNARVQNYKPVNRIINYDELTLAD